jgi:hypothetical protein
MLMWVAVYVIAGWLVASLLTAPVLALLFRGAELGRRSLPLLPAPRQEPQVSDFVVL